MKQEFTKKDLRSGMLVELRDGEVGLIMLNTESGDAIVSNSEKTGKVWGDLSNWDDLLCEGSASNRDVVKVFGMITLENNRDRASFSLDRRKLLWERAAEIPEYTLEEIAFIHKFRCKCGGYPFQYGGFWVCNSCGGKGVDEEWWKIKVEKDGDAFCCRGLDFINLQESDNYAFGKTFYEAIEEYEKVMMLKNQTR